MMKYIVTVAMLMASIQPAFANSVWDQVDFNQIENNELLQDEAQFEADYARSNKGAAIVGGIIGGIIGGLIAADKFDKHPHPHKFRRVVCYAESRSGRLFRAVGTHARRVQAMAMDQCYRASRFCRPLGCEGRW